MEQDRDEEQKKLKALWRVPLHFPFFFFLLVFFRIDRKGRHLKSRFSGSSRLVYGSTGTCDPELKSKLQEYRS